VVAIASYIARVIVAYIPSDMTDRIPDASTFAIFVPSTLDLYAVVAALQIKSSGIFPRMKPFSVSAVVD